MNAAKAASRILERASTSGSVSSRSLAGAITPPLDTWYRIVPHWPHLVPIGTIATSEVTHVCAILLFCEYRVRNARVEPGREALYLARNSQPAEGRSTPPPVDPK